MPFEGTVIQVNDIYTKKIDIIDENFVHNNWIIKD
ncbi:MAG: hypothetical protein ACK4ND_05860 [Cytophagaceae bacterium]